MIRLWWTFPNEHIIKIVSLRRGRVLFLYFQIFWSQFKEYDARQKLYYTNTKHKNSFWIHVIFSITLPCIKTFKSLQSFFPVPWKCVNTKRILSTWNSIEYMLANESLKVLLLISKNKSLLPMNSLDTSWWSIWGKKDCNGLYRLGCKMFIVLLAIAPSIYRSTLLY